MAVPGLRGRPQTLLTTTPGLSPRRQFLVDVLSGPRDGGCSTAGSRLKISRRAAACRNRSTITAMTTLLLDANAFTRDWLMKGLAFQLFEHMVGARLSVLIPAVVFEELIANHGREVERTGDSLASLSKERRGLGLGPVTADPSAFDYRAYVEERFDERLAFGVLPWPTVSHQDLVARAVSRTPPFDSKGGGYRDALIWSDVVQLARAGHDVAFVSSDKGFLGQNGQLAAALKAEIEPLDGSVELVCDLKQWLLEGLPWRHIGDLAAALTLLRTEEFEEWLLQSDFQDYLEPDVTALGFSRSPYRLRIEEVSWSGAGPDAVDGSTNGDENDLTLVQYDLHETVSFWGQFPEGVEIEPGWKAQLIESSRLVEVEGTIDMVLRVAVLYPGEFTSFDIEELSWRRADGSGAGAPIHQPDRNQPTLWD